MSSLRFARGNRFVWEGVLYEVMRVLPDNSVNIENLATTVIRLVTMPELVEALFAGRLQFERPGAVANRQSGEPSPDQPPFRELEDYSEYQAATARFRHQVISQLPEECPRTVLEEVVALWKANHPDQTISVASIYRWRADYTNSGHDIRSLVPQTDRDGRKSRIRPEVNEIIEAVIKDEVLSRRGTSAKGPQPKLPSNKRLHREVAVRIHEVNSARPGEGQLELPSERTIARRVAKLDPIAVFAARHGSILPGRNSLNTAKWTIPLSRWSASKWITHQWIL